MLRRWCAFGPVQIARYRDELWSSALFTASNGVMIQRTQSETEVVQEASMQSSPHGAHVVGDREFVRRAFGFPNRLSSSADSMRTTSVETQNVLRTSSFKRGRAFSTCSGKGM